MIGISPGPGKGCPWAHLRGRACWRAGACLEAAGQSSAEIRGAGGGHGRAPAEERPPVQDGPRARRMMIIWNAAFADRQRIYSDSSIVNP